jgi:hypothetical protein
MDIILIVFGGLNLVMVPVGIIKRKYGVAVFNFFAATICLLTLIYN